VFEISNFLLRTGHTHKSLAKELKCSSGLIGMYASHKAVPSYENCELLLKLGMSIEEIFGAEAAQNAVIFCPNKKDLEKERNSFNKKVGHAIVELLNEGFFKLKKEV
jgi:hypothetical protein